MLYYLPLLLLGPAQGSLASGQRQQHATTAWQAHRTTARRLQQNDFSGSTIPADFTPLDRAAETQRIYRSVAAERWVRAREAPCILPMHPVRCCCISLLG
jgi:hypothetical protein